MAGSQERMIIRHEVAAVGFGMHTEEEILKLSAVRVTSQVTFDALANPLVGGLYDPAMGPVDPHSVCVTCGLTMRDCPGHLGHIVLSVPVYNPLTFPTVVHIMKVKCFSCHRFRGSANACRMLTIKLMMIECGEWETARDLHRNLGPKEDREVKLKEHEQRLKTMTTVPWTPGECKAYRRALIKEFLSACNSSKVCDRCGAGRSVVRKDGHAKLFLRGEAVKSRRAQASMLAGIAMGKSALEQVQFDERKDGDSSEEEGPDILQMDDSDDDSEMEEEEEETKSGRKAAATNRLPDKYMAPVEVQMHVRLLWENEGMLAGLIWGKSLGSTVGHQRPFTGRPLEGLGKDGWKLFFWKILPVPPSRFRPPCKNDDGSMTEHPQNHNLSKVIMLDTRIRDLSKRDSTANDDDAQGAMAKLDSASLARVISTWIEMQNAVNVYIDSSKDTSAKLPGDIPPGIRQGLEKKEGLFRMHMMGKRVNFACRSVISPDPYLGTSEIGIPVRFAKVLTYPQPVTPWNVVTLRKLVENGPDIYPGANYVEDPRGRLVDLRRMTPVKRTALSARLLTPPGQKVWRHLHDGDVCLLNRQPTLHKPGIMAHHARVLRNPAQQTIRMHYANCNTYNADFDGDEMNCHLPQDELSRAEAEVIACTNEQYIVPTNGKPLRGLIQDHVASGVKLTSKDCFLTREEFQHLLFCTLAGLPRLEIVPPEGIVEMVPPTIWKPKMLWSGKQVVTAVLKHLTARLPPLNLNFKAKTPSNAFGPDHKDGEEVIFRGGELLVGVLDKAAFGASEFGLVHAVYEFYGPHFAGKLLTALGRLFTIYLQFAGHTCGIEDLVLSKEADARRSELYRRTETLGQLAMSTFLTQGPSFDAKTVLTPPTCPSGLNHKDLDDLRDRTGEYLEEDIRTGQPDRAVAIDNFMRTVLSPLSTEVIKTCLPDGLAKPFPANAFGLMVATGAKGSTVNQSQVSCGLGQQELEGRRVPLMPSGKSLPTFQPYDPTPRAGGYISDRFLTGIRPAEYYFHCMAGREGLIDTAVKTSRSGYLQRCLVKGLEELRVHYDYTVRDSDLGVVQFLYGEDGIDTMHGKYLDCKMPEMMALARNYGAMAAKYSVLSKKEKDIQAWGLDTKTAMVKHKQLRQVQDGEKESQEEDDDGEEEKEPTFTVGDVVEARRLKSGRGDWVRGAWRDGWVTAEVVKVHEGGKHARYSLKYQDGSVAKKVPVTVKLPRTAMPSSGLTPLGRHVRVIRRSQPDPVMSRSSLGSDLGAVSERFQKAIDDYMEKNPDGLIRPGGLDELNFQRLLWLKYMRSLAAPGEAVGSIAGQSIGEPSTQMTLNTFHLAGHGGANVTLGIPRLREIIMSASQNIKTPSMMVPFCKGIERNKAELFAQRLRKLQLGELIHHEAGVVVTERLARSGRGPWERHYHVKLHFYSDEQTSAVFGLQFEDILTVITDRFLKVLLNSVATEIRKTAAAMAVTSTDAPSRGRGASKRRGEDEDGGGDDEEGPKAQGSKGQTPGGEEDDEDDEENALEDNDEQGTLHFGRKKEGGEYDEDESEDDEEEEKQMGETEAEGPEASAAEEEMAAATTDGKRKRNAPLVSALEQATLSHPSFVDIKAHPREATVEIVLKSRASQRRLLMVPLVEAAAAKHPVRSSNGINQSFVVDGKSGLTLQTLGCNLMEVWEAGYGMVELNQLVSNDIWAIHQIYGVEAARTSIMAEVGGVFGAYGISVDPRHLGLVADFMTCQGGFRPLNRMGMRNNSSPFLQMSFETTANFLTEAAMSGDWDNLSTPSARLVMGQVSGTGTGGFSLMVPLRSKAPLANGSSKKQKKEKKTPHSSRNQKKSVVEGVAMEESE